MPVAVVGAVHRLGTRYAVAVFVVDGAVHESGGDGKRQEQGWENDESDHSQRRHVLCNKDGSADSEARAVRGLARMVEKEVRKRVERVCERWHHLAHLQRRMGGARRRPGTLLGEHCPYIMQLASRQSQSRIALYGLNCEKN